MMDAQEAKRRHDAQGYIHFRQPFSGKEFTELRNAFEKAEQNSALRDLLNQDAVFLKLVDHPIWFPAVRAVVGEDVMVRYCTGGIIQPHSESGSGWHCDLSKIRAINLTESVIMMKLFVYIEDVPEDSACLAVVPGSHRFAEGHPLPDIQRQEEMPHHLKLTAKAGDVVLMNSYTWHARFHNRSPHPRKVIELSYIHFWMKPQYDFETFNASLQQRILSSHNLKQLFGVPIDGVSDSERRLEPVTHE